MLFRSSEAEAHAQLDRAMDLGINFVDVAEMYSVPPKPETFGASEACIGTWLKKRPEMRKKIVLATKVTGMNNAMPHVRDGKGRLDRANIVAALDGSLANSPVKVDPVFGLSVPVNIHGVPQEVLDARGTWKDAAAYDAQAKKLAEMFRENMKKFGPAVDEKILGAGPKG